MRLVISIDELKPHWAIKQGMGVSAEKLGMTNVHITGDFDAKLTYIYGDVSDLSQFKKLYAESIFEHLGNWARVRPKYDIEIDVSTHECDNYGQWANYGTIVAEGDTLEELIDNASVDVMDQDGGELHVGPADAAWMQDLIEEKFMELLEKQVTAYKEQS